MIETGSLIQMLLFFFIIAGLVFLMVPLLRRGGPGNPEAGRLRRFSGVSEYFQIFFKVFRAMSSIGKTAAEDRISPELSEKIMLAVTGVNKCANCSYLHTRTALEKGVSMNEIRQLLSGEYKGGVQEELPAVLFAQHFAETKGNISPEAEARVVETYGAGKVATMSAYLLSVLFGNLCSNTVYHYTHSGLSFKERAELFPVYTLSRPVRWIIYRNGRKHDRIVQAD